MPLPSVPVSQASISRFDLPLKDLSPELTSKTHPSKTGHTDNPLLALEPLSDPCSSEINNRTPASASSTADQDHTPDLPAPSELFLSDPATESLLTALVSEP